jgi:hypothetical protein
VYGKKRQPMTKLRMHHGGRPALYRREMCDRLIEAMAEGLTAKAAAAKIGISARSLEAGAEEDTCSGGTSF